ncbi:MerR family transcriptional regulator [Thalassobacillus pellis]|uniref:MerR family transcriptional regulator n=1 Tax=Thalassobacillus pellis TaxID=748008 RepID=UPI0019603567|nr:MerR family transcriptional regulator [Thalassobacillus pellis]MBM7553492.1 DNA-binding transcriptional MerR regulator [Thalassobacillus pellis]
MEYTITKFAKLAGVSSRTLRYYDEIGILKPARINSSGYRIYGPEQVNQLQQILFYRELGMELEKIRNIITSPTFDPAEALSEHRTKLLAKRTKLNKMIASVDQSLAAAEGRITMSDNEKFEAFKQKLVDDNEEKFGEEAREKYGDETVDKSNQKVLGMSEEKYAEVNRIEMEMKEALSKGMAIGDPASEPAQKAADLHRKWLTYFWDKYTKEAHAGVAQMYVDDERFTAYYDHQQPGTAEFLRDAVHIYTGMNS